jgi:hypothetical protein
MNSTDDRQREGEFPAPARHKIDMDLVFSLSALLISAIAVAASLYQLHMASSSISAQTWPYLTIGWGYGNDQTSLALDNDGLGPALIRDVVLTVDGHPQSDVVSAMRQIVHGADGALTLDALTAGVVVRAGRSLNVFDVRGASWNERTRQALPRIDLQLCYCSVLGRCWSTSLRSNEPRDIPRCAEQDASGLKAPGPQ